MANPRFRNRPWLVRLGILVFLAAVYFVQDAVFLDLRESAAAPCSFEFRVPLPADYAATHGIAPLPDLERVVLTGFFADWNPAASQGVMRPVGEGRWTVSVLLPPGDNQYKFVLYLRGRAEPLWIHDVTNPDAVPDSFGGLNSVRRVPDYAPLATAVRLVVLGLLGLQLCYCLLDPLLGWLLLRRFPFRFKLVAALSLLALLSNLIFIAYHLHEERGLVREGVHDALALVHLVLRAGGVDFRNLEEPANLAVLERSLRGFFRRARVRVEKDKPSNLQQTLSDLALFSAELRPLVVLHRAENEKLQEERARRYGFPDSRSWLIDGLLGPLLAAERQARTESGTMDYSLRVGIPEARLLAQETAETRQGTAALGFSTFLLPIHEQGLLVGYYGGTIQTKLYGGEILRILRFNLFLLVLSGALSVLLLRRIGLRVTAHLQELAAWSERINAGDFSIEKQIRSGDEIEQLAENFNAMRLSLAAGFRRIEEQNRRLRIEAYVDRLTCLPNRHKLQNDLEEEGCHALVLFNVDGFRRINDLFGSEVGDFVLIEVGSRLLELADETLSVYALGSDEYVVRIRVEIERHLLENLVLRCCDVIMENPYLYMENEIFISVTAGGVHEAVPPGAAAKGPAPEPATAGLPTVAVRRDVLTDAEASRRRNRSPLARADRALCAARKLAVRWLFHDQGMETAHRYELNIQWTRKLKEAIREDRVVPYFQPIVDNRTGRVAKYECLARLIERDGSVITPDSFLRISKQSRFYRFITRIIVEKSFEEFRQASCDFSVNISIEDILEPHTSRFLVEKVLAEPEAARRLVFEIVETAEIENYAAVVGFIERVKPCGCRIAIDDFGSGYSNFEHLLKLHVDYLKIDASLVRNIDRDEQARVIVRSIARFARELGIATIAEYVHNQDVQARCQEYGVDYSQGYLFGGPAPRRG